MSFTKKEFDRLARSLRTLQIDAVGIRVENFVASILGLNPIQRLVHFPSPDVHGIAALTVAKLTEVRETILRDKVTIPSFVIFPDNSGNWVISGLLQYLYAKWIDTRLLNRLYHHQRVREALIKFGSGHDLELLGAAILDKECSYGEATRGSGDQGIDAVRLKSLLEIEPAFCNAGVGLSGDSHPHPGDKVFFLASSKAMISARASGTKVINPAHIRELVGAWLIQRDNVGKWREMGIQMLSPIQLILITTYRLSDESTNDCRKLGIQVWGVPQLIYLICKTAPDDVFDSANSFAFSKVKFNEWWRSKNSTRLKP